MLFRLFTVFAVLALAVSTWILSSPMHRPAATVNSRLTELPGYYLKKAVMTDYDEAGVPSVRIVAERIDQVGHGLEVLLSDVHLDYQAPNGQNWVMVGDVAHVEPGGKIIDVSGNVMLNGEGAVHANGAVIHADALTYDVPQGLVTSKSDVRVEFGAHTLNGRGLVANLKERTIHLEKVNGRFQR